MRSFCFVHNVGRFLIKTAVEAEACETNSEDEVDNEYLSADGHTHDVSNYDDPDVAQKRCMKTASVQGHKSQSDAARLAACQISEQENCDSYLLDDDAGEDTTVQFCSVP